MFRLEANLMHIFIYCLYQKVKQNEYAIHNKTPKKCADIFSLICFQIYMCTFFSSYAYMIVFNNVAYLLYIREGLCNF